MQMLFKHGLSNEWEGINYDYIVVEYDDIDAHLADGWVASIHELGDKNEMQEQKQGQGNEQETVQEVKRRGRPKAQQ